MRRSKLFLALFFGAAVLPACSSDDSGGDGGSGGGTAGSGGTGGTAGGTGQPAEVTVDTFNIAMAGAFIPNAEERRQPLLEGIASSEADILCLQEVWEQQDKEAVIAATGVQYPHVVMFTHDPSTVVDDPTDQNGEVPTPPSEPACADSDLATKLDAVVACMVENCNTDPGNPDGYATSTACAQEKCLGEAEALLLGDAAHKRCYACAAVNLPSERFSDIASACKTELNADLAFNGQSSLMILSKYPLSDAKDWVLPGTYNRRIIASATATLDNGATLDVHCNHLTPIFSSVIYPYTGPYGEGATDAAGWEAEQYLQAGKLLAWVKQESGSSPAVILGDMNAGREYASASPPIMSEGAATLDLLETEFVHAVTPDYAPLCTYCDTNGNNDTDTPEWIDHIYMFNLDASSVLSSKRVYDDDVVPVDDGNGGTINVPLSDHYGMRAVISVPAP